MSKKILSIIPILVIFLLICVGNVYAASSTKIGQQLSIYGILGDLSLDRKITSLDLTLLKKHVNNGSYLAPFAKKRADVNGDGKIDSEDVSELNNYISNLETELSKITDIKISGPTTLKRGDLIQLTAEPIPNIANAKISWSSSNILKAIVIGNGNVIGFSYGDVTIKVKIGDFEKSYPITVKDDEIGKIEIVSNPNKLEYNIGEKINKIGLKIKAISKDGNTEKLITNVNDFTLNPDTVNKAGEQKIKVTYNGKSAYFNITAGSLGSVDSTYIDTATSMPETMENSTDYWKVKIQKGMLHNEIHLGKKAYKNYNTQSIALFYANRILGADIDASELNIYIKDKGKKSNSAYWDKGNYKYSETYTSFNEQLKTIYSELVKGYPVLIRVTNEKGNAQYVVIYGVTKTTKSSTKLSASDFRVMDPSNGNGKQLSEYYQYAKDGKPIYSLVTFIENPVSNIEITGNTSVAINSTAQLKAIVKNTGNAEIKIPKLLKVKWSLNKKSTKATINSNGLVTAGSKTGPAIATVTSEVNKNVTNNCTITICEPYGGTEIPRKDSDDAKIIKFFKSNINGKTYTIVDQNKQYDYPKTHDGKYWLNKCSRAAALCIASSMGNATLKELVDAAECEPFDKDPYGNKYFENFGLENLGTNFKNDYQSAVKEYVKKGYSIALYFKSPTGSTTNSNNNWATTAHWIAIIGYDEVDGKKMMYVADSGHYNSGWYPINEFSKLTNIKHVYVIKEE